MINWKKIKKIADRNALFLETIPEDFLDEDVKMSEEELVTLLWLLIDDMETEDGKIKRSRKNFFMVSNVDQIFRTFTAGAGLLLVTGLISKIQRVITNNIGYYGSILDSATDKFKSVKNSIIQMVNKRVGITTEGSAVPGGYVSDLMNMSSVKNEARELIYKKILSEPKPSDLKRDIQVFISGDGENEMRGAIKKFYSRFTGSSFSNFDRMASSQFSIQYGLKKFVYYGTIIKTSRAFCRKKINGIYTVEEGMLWPYENPKPLGISNTTYNPVVDMGGENCRHLPYFVTDLMAEEMDGRGFFGFNG